MSNFVFLFVLRLLGATLLLGFLGGMAYMIYQDGRLSSALLASRRQTGGQLLVIASESESLPLGMAFPLRAMTSIGRAAGSSIPLADDFASSEHALVVRRGDVWQVEDLGSRNGTLLNGAALEETAVVASGDIITIGSTQLKFEI